MDILILGGTQFLGRHITEAALNAGHRVTLLNRGTTNPNLFPTAEKLTGNRNSDLSALEGRRWDVVIDTSGYLPSQVRRSAEALADVVKQYVFISTISVYADETRTESDESATLAHLEDPNDEELTGETYGALKVLCEQTVESLLTGRVLTVRSGLIVGPHDPTDRFTYWPVRIAKGGEVLAPGNPNRQVQFIDARDQAAWIMKMIAVGQNGIFNVTGPERLTMRGLLDTCREASKSDARLTWVDEIFLLEQGVRPWVDLPLWLPDSFNGMMTLNISKALAAGLTFRPLSETVADTLRWNASRPAEDTALPKAGMMLDQEAQILSAWKARR